MAMGIVFQTWCQDSSYVKQKKTRDVEAKVPYISATKLQLGYDIQTRQKNKKNIMLLGRIFFLYSLGYI